MTRTKTYVATRDQLKVNEGSVHGGEGYPASEVTPSLLALGWVHEGRGTQPVDTRTHALFATGELETHEPASDEAIAAFQAAQATLAPAVETAAPVREPAPKKPKKTSKEK